MIRDMIALLELSSALAQIGHFKKTKSVYGYSFDFLLLNFIEKVLFFISSLSYLTQDLTRKQYSRRFPLYPEVPFSKTTHFLTCFDIFLITVMGIQCLKYRSSRHSFQSISKNFLFLITFFVIITLIMMYYSTINLPQDIGKHGMLYIDLADWIWLWASVTGSFKYFPQLVINWFGMCVTGISFISLWTQFFATLFVLIFELSSNEDFHFSPVNKRPLIMYSVQSVLISVIIYQTLLYKQNHPYLKTLIQKQKIIV